MVRKTIASHVLQEAATAVGNGPTQRETREGPGDCKLAISLLAEFCEHADVVSANRVSRVMTEIPNPTAAKSY